MPDKKTSINPVVMYGYNGVSVVRGGYSDYNMTSYGFTFGANVDVKVGVRGNKFTAGIYVPIRSEKFMDNYDRMKNDYRIDMKNNLIPITLTVGYDFKLN